MIAHAERVFVDSGAWIALAISVDAMHARAVEEWEVMQRAGARILTSLPVLIETFTYRIRVAFDTHFAVAGFRLVS